MKRATFFIVCTAFLMVDIAFSGTWLGSDLVVNGDFESGLTGWQKINSDWVTLGYSNTNTNYAYRYYGSGDLRQNVQVELGKRYRLQGRAAGEHAYLEATDVVPAIGWHYVISLSVSPYQSDIGIASTNQTTVILSGKAGGSYSLKFDHIKLQQVVYDPQINIMETALELNAVSLLATAVLNLQDLSFADTPTDWWIDWGDGTIDYNPTLNALAEHTYNISGGIMDYTATFYGENQAGNMTDTVGIMIVPEPATLLFVLGALPLMRRKSK